MQHVDLIIVGGGLVGAGLAVALKQSGLSIALLDARLPSNDDPRLFALNSSSCQFLKNIGVWNKLSAYASPIHQVHVSRQKKFGAVRLNREEVNVSALGYVIPAHYIETVLNEALLSLPNVTLQRPAKLQQITQDDNLATLTIETPGGEKVLTSSIVIGADGTQSTVRAQLNIQTKVVDYKQSALVTRTVLNNSHQQIAYERFTLDGAIAMLPLIDNECATIWTASNETIARLTALSDESFLQELQKEFGYRLGRLQQIKKRHVFPLQMIRAEKAVEKNVFLLGNSAHTLHPIAAQGFNLALYEVAALAECILEKTVKQEKFSTTHLQEISEQTQKQQATSIGVSHRLSHLFENNTTLMSAGLQLGMVGLDLFTPLKKKFIKGMMGRAGKAQIGVNDSTTTNQRYRRRK